MARVDFSARAKGDLTGILTFLVQDSGLRTATKYDASFARLFDRLADHPVSGAPRPNLGRQVRIGVVSPYVLI